MRVWVPVLLVIFFAGEVREGAAQTRENRSPAPKEAGLCTQELGGAPLDVRGLALVYCTSRAGVARGLSGAHVSARPVFYGAVPAAWGRAALTQTAPARAAAYRLTLTQGLTYGLVVGVKHLVGRPRPYVYRPLQARASRHRPPAPGDAYLSFPSGHAALSSALVTSWSASYPRWYVLAPGAVWATSVALSRVYLGVHYPSDVIVGTLLGAGIALLVDQLGRAVTPAPFRTGPGAGAGVPLVLRVTF